MTNEEAIKYFEHDRFRRAYDHEAALLAIDALRAQQTPAKLDRSRLEGCPVCVTKGCETCKYTYCSKNEYPCCDCSNVKKYEPDGFCTACGRPLNEEAWAELERRINGETIDN